MQKLLRLLFTFSLFATWPAFAGVAVIGGLTRQHTVKPGEAFEGVLLVKNTGKAPLEINFTQTDYTFTADGESHYDKPGTHPRSNARWIALNPPRATIPPLETVSIYYQGRMPDAATLAGTYWSMIMVEPVAAHAPLAEGGQNQVAMGVQAVMRYAVQVITTLGTSGTEQLAILDKKMLTEAGKSVLQLDVANTGERMQTPTLSAELFNAQGVSIGHFHGGRQRIYPQCSVRFKIEFADVPPGKYLAMVVMDSGSDYVTGAQYTLEIAP